MADSFVSIPVPEESPVQVDTQLVNSKHREVVVLGDPNTPGGLLSIDATKGAKVYLGSENALVVPGSSSAAYSNVTGDFIATANSTTKTITLSSFASTTLSSVLSVSNLVNGSVKRISSLGAIDTLPLTTLSYSTNVYTLTDMAANFAVGDQVVVSLLGPDKALDEAYDAMRVRELFRLGGENNTADVMGTIFKPVNDSMYMPLVQDNTFSSRVTKKLTKASAGNIYAFQVFNFGSSLAYFQIHDKATTPAATDVPKTGCSWPVPPGNSLVPGCLFITPWDLAPSQRNETGLGWAISATLSTFTDSLTATDFVVTGFRYV